MSQNYNILQRYQNFFLSPINSSHNHLALLSLCLYLNPTANSAPCQHLPILYQLLPDFPVRFLFDPFLSRLASKPTFSFGWILIFYGSVFLCLLGMGSYFSLVQWQELELQALIFRYMSAGAAVPHELLQPIKKSLLHTPSYFLHHPLQHYPHYRPACKF